MTSAVFDFADIGAGDPEITSSLPSLAWLERRYGVVSKTTLPASELWVDVVVNRRRIPIPKQALYAAASFLRSASGERVRWEDCASAVGLVLSAMEAHGVSQFGRSA